MCVVVIHSLVGRLILFDGGKTAEPFEVENQL